MFRMETAGPWKVDYHNRDSTIGSGDGNMDVTHDKVPVNKGNSKRCSLHERNVTRRTATGGVSYA